MLRAAVLLSALCLPLAGCDCSGNLVGDRDGDGGDVDPSDDGGGGDRDGSSGGRDARVPGRDAAGFGPEVCDSVDNDGNGIIDDVDAGGDGICDCLRIATLGEPGPWGVGDVFSTWLDDRSDMGAVSLGDELLTPELLAGYQVIVVQDVRARAYSITERAALDEWVRGGGGLMTLIGYGDSSERANVNDLLASTGIQYDEDPVLAGSPTIPVTTWNPHPVSEAVTRVGVDNGYAVIGEGEVVAEEAGTVMLRARSLGEGRVLVWGDEWITYDSEWAATTGYQVERFWLNAIKWLTPVAECQVPIII